MLLRLRSGNFGVRSLADKRAEYERPLPVIRHAGELALLGLPLLLFVPGYLRFFLGIGIIDQRHVFFCSAANKGDATRQQQQKGNRSFRSSSQHK